MNIAANVLLVLLIPLTILCNVVLRESQRAQGPDVMGPAFVFVVSCGIPWIAALIIIGLLVDRISAGDRDSELPRGDGALARRDLAGAANADDC